MLIAHLHVRASSVLLTYYAADLFASCCYNLLTVSDAVLRMAEAFYWCRDMINTPAEDMSPQDLAAEAAALAATHAGALYSMTCFNGVLCNS